MASELRGGLHVRLRDCSAAPGRRYGSVDTESGLHPFDGARLGVLASFATALFFDCMLAQQIGRMVGFKVGSFKLLNAPE